MADETVEGGETRDEGCRAHERVDDQARQVETPEDETITTTAPSTPPRTPLEGECASQASAAVNTSVREPDKVEATQDQGQAPPATTSASARSALCNHPAETETTTDPARPSEDPADATGDDERRPDEPTEPPDKPEGAGRQDGEQSIEEVESSEAEVSRESTDGAEATGDDGDQGSPTSCPTGRKSGPQSPRTSRSSQGAARPPPNETGASRMRARTQESTERS